MLINYLKTIFRAIRAKPGYFFTCVINISVSLMCVILIYLFVRDEWSYDRRDKRTASLYRISADEIRETGEVVQNAFSPLGWAPLLHDEFPEVKAYSRFMHYRMDMLVGNQEANKSFYEKHFVWADSNVFDVMPFELIKGDPKTALHDLNSVVISESTAHRFFGNEEPVGRRLRFQNQEDLEVTGVMRDIPDHSHFKADFFRAFRDAETSFDPQRWDLLYFYSYIKVAEGTDIDQLVSKLTSLLHQRLKPEVAAKFRPTAAAYSDIYLHSRRTNELVPTGKSWLSWLLIQVAVLILAMAVANFINLSTARSMKRAREIGIRKALGGLRWALALQFLLESVCYVLFALVIAFLLAQLSLPAFNRLVEKNLALLESPDLKMIGLFVVVGIAVGIVSGIYPALRLSTFKTISALKGIAQTDKQSRRVRQVLVVFQFITCSLLINAAFMIYKQVNYMVNKSPGYTIDQTVLIPITTIEVVPFNTFPVFKNEFSRVTGVERVSFSSHRLAGDQPYDADYTFEDTPLEINHMTMGRVHVDFDFVKTYSIKMIAGRDFSERLPADTASFLINRSAIKALGFKSPEEALSRKVNYISYGIKGGYQKRGNIVGVVEDFNFRSLHHAVQPMVMDIQPARYHCIAVKLSTHDMGATLRDLEAKWHTVLPTIPFQFIFLDQTYREQYRAELNTSELTNVLSVISLFIALLGLVGLASFMLEQRKKEIGVRKVVGASAFSIVKLFSWEYLKIFLMGFVLAVPVSFYFFNEWLRQFAYRIEMPVLSVMLTLVAIVLIAWASVAYQTIKASLVNPTKVLRQD